MGTFLATVGVDGKARPAPAREMFTASEQMPYDWQTGSTVTWRTVRDESFMESFWGEADGQGHDRARKRSFKVMSLRRTALSTITVGVQSFLCS